MKAHNAIKTKDVVDLLEAVHSMQDLKELKLFLSDLLTENELLEFSRRWKAARLLEDKVSYTEIIAQTGLSSTTVARISRWLNDGQGGYRLALARTK